MRVRDNAFNADEYGWCRKPDPAEYKLNHYVCRIERNQSGLFDLDAIETY
jgi:hypothetical protein